MACKTRRSYGNHKTVISVSHCALSRVESLKNQEFQKDRPRTFSCEGERRTGTDVLPLRPLRDDCVERAECAEGGRGGGRGALLCACAVWRGMRLGRARGVSATLGSSLGSATGSISLMLLCSRLLPSSCRRRALAPSSSMLFSSSWKLVKKSITHCAHCNLRVC